MKKVEEIIKNPNIQVKDVGLDGFDGLYTDPVEKKYSLCFLGVVVGNTLVFLKEIKHLLGILCAE